MSFGLRVIALSVAAYLSLGGVSLSAETNVNAANAGRANTALQDMVAVDGSDVDSVIASANAAGQGAVSGVGVDAGVGDAIAVSPATSKTSKTLDVTAQQLPDSVNASIPDDAMLVSPDLAVTKQGEVKDVETGATVTDPAVVGTQDTPPDPLDKTDGKSYIPVSVSDVKAEVGAVDNSAAKSGKAAESANAGDSADSLDAADSASFIEGQARVMSATQGNQWGAYWGTYNGTQAFFEDDDTLFVQNAKWVVDVSKHNGTIDWQRAKNAGVQGAIIRVGYGAGNPIDEQALRNISECKRLGIPFGVYLYSYAGSVSMAEHEGESVVGYLRQAGVSPSDLSYPVYYDMEQWTWAGHSPSSDPSVNASYAQAFWRVLEDAGFGGRIAIYSYTSYLNSALNSQWIHDRTDWVAQYSGKITYNGWAANADRRAWQYTSSGQIDGIGTVDMNAFGVHRYEVKGEMGTEWQRIGAERSVIGRPVADEVCVWGGGRDNCYQNFENGAISWTPSTGAHYTSGEIRGEWRDHDFERGIMGYPTADESCSWNSDGSGSCTQEFQSGSILWKSGRGAHYVAGDIRAEWFSRNASNNGFPVRDVIGFPVADEVCVWGGGRDNCYQNFENGAISWTPSTGAHYTSGVIRDEWRSRGFEFGRLGYPVEDEHNLGDDWWSQRFQHGEIRTYGNDRQMSFF